MGNVWDAMKKHEQEPGQPEKPAIPSADRKAGITPPSAAPSVPPQREAVVVGAKDYSPVLVVHHDRGGKLSEQYRRLRTNLMARSPQGCLCLAITSAEPGEGKTVTCLNFSLVLEELPGIRVVVIDGDMRKGSLSELLQTEKTPGLAEVLRGSHSLEEAIHPTFYPNLDVIPCGEANKTELGTLLGAFPKSGVVSQLRKQYDCILIDTPAAGVISGACILAHEMGESLLVVKMHKTNLVSVERAVGLLKAADVKILGMFLTHQTEYVPTYFSKYYY